MTGFSVERLEGGFALVEAAGGPVSALVPIRGCPAEAEALARMMAQAPDLVRFVEDAATASPIGLKHRAARLLAACRLPPVSGRVV